MSSDTPSFDLFRKRPLELRVRDMRDEDGGGISETEANRLDRTTCDAFFIIRAMIDDGKVALLTGSMEGVDVGPVATSMLYRMWLSMGGYLVAKSNPEDADEVKMAKTVASFLRHLQLEELLGRYEISVNAAPETSPLTACETAPDPE